MRNSLYIILIVLLSSSCACKHKSSPIVLEDMEKIEKEYKKPMMDWNHEKVHDQDLQIKKFAERRSWEMTRTGSGLYFEIFENGTGQVADSGDIATFNYNLHLFDGTYCYSSDSTGPRKLELGKAEIESGLEEALLMMQIGDKARIIIPPHLAYGMPGDGYKIPSDAILIYKIELTKLQ